MKIDKKWLKSQLTSAIIGGVIGFLIGVILANSIHLVTEIISPKPKVDLSIHRTYWDEIDNLKDLEYIGNEILLSANNPVLNEGKYGIFSTPVRKDIKEKVDTWITFDYPYMKNCHNCFQYWFIIKNKGEIEAKNIDIYIYNNFKIRDVRYQDFQINFKKGTDSYSDRGIHLNIEKLDKDKSVRFSFVTDTKIDFSYECYVDSNKNYCKSYIGDLHVVDIDLLEQKNIDSIYFKRYNRALTFPDFSEQNQCYEYNIMSGKLDKFNCEIICV